MDKKIILLIVIVLVSMLLISGCAQIDRVKSGTVTNIATTAKDKIQSTAGTLLGVGKNIVTGIK